MPLFDWLVAELFAPLAVWVCISGLDDAFLDLQFAWRWLRGKLNAPVWPRSGPRPSVRTALLIPCWNEEGVLEGMLERNSGSIRDPRCDIWVGLYPNDRDSIAAFDRARAYLPRIHKAVGPHAGPTTKADNLNAVWARILAYERLAGRDYDAVLLHDAEDVVHPLESEVAACALERCDMAQFPVLPIETPLRDWTHGVYCDEFAESHIKDLRLRAAMGGFIPSAGVGTALRREVLDRLRIERGDELLNPRCLTEDYFLGLDIHAMGFRQDFPVLRDPDDGELIATRAYFPRSFLAAVRQRTRWIIGNNLQSWERFGWRVGRRQIYWLWRDRKGLLNHGVSLLTNLCFFYSAASWSAARSSGNEWLLGDALGASPTLVALLWVNALLLVWRGAVRIACCRQVYGWRHSLTAPLRAPWANLINFCATTRALTMFLAAKRRKRRLNWSKTAHAFPPNATRPPPVPSPGPAAPVGAAMTVPAGAGIPGASDSRAWSPGRKARGGP